MRNHHIGQKSSNTAREVSRAVMTAAAIGSLVLSANAFGPGELTDAVIPVKVNAGARVSIQYNPGVKGEGAVENVTANASKDITIRIAASGNHTSVSRGQTRQAAPVMIAHGRGGVSLRLPAQTFANANIALHTLNGKRVMRAATAAATGNYNFSRQNLAPGVYILSVKGASGNTFASRVSHSGGKLNINIIPINQNAQALDMTADAAAAGDGWRITASAPGYHTHSEDFNPVAGRNAERTITLTQQSALAKENFTETVGSGSNAATFDMLYVPGGSTCMGSTSTSGSCGSSNPQATLSNYFIAKNVVTPKLWNAVMGENKTCMMGGTNCAFTAATFYDFQEFVCRLSKQTGKNYRMMTEAEFEYAVKRANSSGMANLGSDGTTFSGFCLDCEEWAYNSWSNNVAGGTDPIGPGGHIHTQKTRRDAASTIGGPTTTGRLIRSIEGTGPSFRMVISADTDYPPGMVPPCDIKAPHVDETIYVNSYRDPRWVTGSDYVWKSSTAPNAAMGNFELRVWEDGTARLGSSNNGTNGQWFTSNNFVLVFVPSSGTSSRYPYIFVDYVLASLISDQPVNFGGSGGGFVGRIVKERASSSYAKPTVTGLKSGKELADAAGPEYKMVNMENPPTNVQDQRLIEGEGYGWFQNNTTAGGTHHYRKDVDADAFRFVVNNGGSNNFLAAGTWFTIGNTFLRVTHSNGYKADYLYTYMPGSGSTAAKFYHNSYIGYERGDFRMFDRVSNSSYSFPCSNCGSELKKTDNAPMSQTGYLSTYVPPPCPAGGCN